MIVNLSRRRCDEVVRADDISDVLLVYCQSCFGIQLIEGEEDVMLDVAIVYFLWWGSPLPNASEHVIARVEA